MTEPKLFATPPTPLLLSMSVTSHVTLVVHHADALHVTEALAVRTNCHAGEAAATRTPPHTLLPLVDRSTSTQPR